MNEINDTLVSAATLRAVLKALEANWFWFDAEYEDEGNNDDVIAASLMLECEIAIGAGRSLTELERDRLESSERWARSEGKEALADAIRGLLEKSR